MNPSHWIGVFDTLTEVSSFLPDETRKGYKFNFNMLFSQAWLKSLVPGTIARTCGVFPYIPNAISCNDSKFCDGRHI